MWKFHELLNVFTLKNEQRELHGKKGKFAPTSPRL
jgi:hypothetical protein